MPTRPITVVVHEQQQSALATDELAEWLAEIADSALSALSLPDRTSVEIVVTDDETVRELNLRHRGLDETTDVLSFSMAPDTEDGGGFVLPPRVGGVGEEAADSIGEVVISWPQSARQAAAGGRDTADEVAFLMAHGILHLMEYDHKEPEERARMEAEHRRLLAAMLGARASDIQVKYGD